MNKIKQIVLPNYFDSMTHYYADGFALAKDSGKISFKISYMGQIMKFIASLKYNKKKDTTFITIDEKKNEDPYHNTIIIKGKPSKTNLKEWLEKNRWIN